MSVKVTILGCGHSGGVPSIGNHWGNCDPDEPRNRRTRPGIAVQSETTTIIVDTGPDFREQINRTDIKKVDAVLYTHAHSDHIAGIDDLRVLRQRHKEMINVYATKPTLDEMYQRVDYMFEERLNLYPQVLVPHAIKPEDFGRVMTIGDIEFIPFEQDHGTCKTLGFRFGSLAYSTDMVRLDDASVAVIKGVETWIVDSASYKMDKPPVHLSLRQVYELNERVGAKRVYLTHMTPAMDYQTLRRELAEGYEPAYDGLVLSG